MRYLFSGLKHQIFAEVFLSRMMQGMFTERGTIEANTLDDLCIHSTWFENNTISQTKINSTGAKKKMNNIGNLLALKDSNCRNCHKENVQGSQGEKIRRIWLNLRGIKRGFLERNTAFG